MLRKIKIENLAVIDYAEFELEEGLCVLTGETGSGKTLIVNAIELLLGARADATKVRTGENAAQIEGVFQNGVKTVMVKHKIISTGRSYAWVDDHPVTISELAERTAHFADLLGQHENQSLLAWTTHIDLLDSFAGLQVMSEAYKKEFHALDEIRARVSHLKNEIEIARQRSKLREFEIRELTEANLDVEEWQEIKSKLLRIDYVEKILECANVALNSISEGENNAIEFIANAEKAIMDIASLVPETVDINQMLETAQTALTEASREISDIADSVNVDPEEAEFLRGRQLLIERLERKYNKDIQGLIQYLSEIKESEEGVAKLEEEAMSNEKDIVNRRGKLVGMADLLREGREKAAPLLAREIQKSLAPLGMENVCFKIKFDRKKETNGPIVIKGERFALFPTGSEYVEFLISPNQGEELKPLASIVSGGELSRIMLAIKALIKSKNFDGISVFDEVDTGIGGDVANAVGLELKRLARDGQILVITHLPQIARLADLHFRIRKFEENGRTKVKLERLSEVARKNELNRMHGGEVNVLTEV
ncbi:AAA family ATPase [bacterium]|nr:AAA family ATPase [bacterium]